VEDGLDENARRGLVAPDFSVAGILRLIGTGPGGQILMALGAGPLRTERLARQVEDFSPRSVYRHVSKMEAHHLIDRQEEPGVPSKVVLRLTQPTGRELFHLLRTFAATPRSRLPGGASHAHSWSSLSLLCELWKFGFADEITREPRTLTQLAGGSHGMTYHQVNRRVGFFLTSGLLMVSRERGHGKRYSLTDHARRRMALIAGIGRWRRHLTTDGAPGLTVGEMATVLRAMLPLPVLPEYVGMSLELGVTGSMDIGGHRDRQAFRCRVDDDGTLRCDEGIRGFVDGSAAATVNTWFAALLDGNRGRIRVRGDLELVDSFVTQLYDILWEEDMQPAFSV
jgi:DNA-binding HxlR family transcriptional regulator